MNVAEDATPADFTWNDAFLLGYDPIDETHHEFVSVVGAMLRCSDDEFPAYMDAFVKHAKEHFEAEDNMMRVTEFPARECHMEEHAAVLKSAYQVRALVAVGNIEIGRSLARELTRWFPGHADYLDSALAQWMCKRKFGGKPTAICRLMPDTFLPAS